MRYHFADHRTQEALLREHFASKLRTKAFLELPLEEQVKVHRQVQRDYERALLTLGNRLTKFYGLNNKYDGRGNRREA